MKLKLRIFFFVNIALALVALLLLGVTVHLGGTLESQMAAERWQGESETGFAQLSCFLLEGKGVTLEGVYEFRQKLETKLTEASMKAQQQTNEVPGESTEEAKKEPTIPQDLSLYIDAWSTTGELTLSGDRGSSKAPVTAVGGNYFFFHPLRLLSGSYISENDLMEDRVILDRELAWKLFGGTDLAGLTVEINGIPFVIAGVVEREKDFATKKAYSGEAGLFMGYRAYMHLAEDNIDCYEIVLPQPISGFAEGMVKDSFPLKGGELLNNSGRFSFAELWRIIRSFGTRSMHTTSVVYPYWENAARCVGDWCALLFALALLFGVVPIVSAFVGVLVFLIRGKNYLAVKVPQLTSDAVEKHRKKRFLKQGAHQKNKEKSIKF